jgi:Tat protein translocase TatB subunit
VFLLILESLGSTELLFILIMALVFFGPRKLPQLSRSLGKNLAEFRKASEDFKRTWEKEVNLEEFDLARDITTDGSSTRDFRTGANQGETNENSTRDNEATARSLQPPMIEAVTPEQAIARHPAGANAFPSPDNTGLESDRSDFDGMTEEAKASSKHDWL